MTVRRSWWGWGSAEDELSSAETEALVARTVAILPDHDFTDHAPPDPADLNVPLSRVHPPSPLASMCSAGALDRLSHARGKAFRDVVRNLQGDLTHIPDLVVRPGSEQDVIDVLDWCGSAEIAVIPYGGGSSVVGGVEPRFDGPAVSSTCNVSTRLLRSMPPVERLASRPALRAGARRSTAAARGDAAALPAVVRVLHPRRLAGHARGRAFRHALHAHRRPDRVPARRDTGRGERVAPAAGIGCRAVPGPAVPRLRRARSASSPRHGCGCRTDRAGRSLRSVAFTNFTAAVAATRAIAQSGLYPGNCRLLDPTEAFLNAGGTAGGGLLLLASSPPTTRSTPGGRAVGSPRTWRHRCQPPRAVGGHDETGPDSRAALLALVVPAHALPTGRAGPAQHDRRDFRNRMHLGPLPVLHAAVTAAATSRLSDICGAGLITCRFTHVYPDGPAPYYGVYAAGRWGATLAQWDEIKAAVSETITDNGGTITHHHAVGRDHRPWYDRQRPQPFAVALRQPSRRWIRPASSTRACSSAEHRGSVFLVTTPRRHQGALSVQLARS